MASIAINNNRAFKSNNIVFKNSQVFSIVNSNRYFPYSLYDVVQSGVLFKFLQPTTVKVDWGDGTSEIFNTYINDENENEFSIKRTPSGEPIETKYSSRGKDYGSAKTRIISFEFDRNLCIYFELSTFVCDVQSLSLPLADFPNLKGLTLQYLSKIRSDDFANNGSLNSFNFDNINKSQIKKLTFNSVFLKTNSLNSELPEEIFLMPLEYLNIGGNYQEKDFENNNFNRIIELKDTLKSLVLTVPFTQNQGLPTNFSQLTNLEELTIENIISLNWTTLPAILADITSLKSLTIAFNTANSLTQLGISFEDLINLKTLDFSRTISSVTNHSWLETIPVSLKNLVLKTFYNQTNLDNSITAIYNKIKSDIKYYGMVLSFESSNTTVQSAIPTGTYRQPTIIGSPASSKERIWELVNIYNCTVTYRSV